MILVTCFRFRYFNLTVFLGACNTTLPFPFFQCLSLFFLYLKKCSFNFLYIQKCSFIIVNSLFFDRKAVKYQSFFISFYFFAEFFFGMLLADEALESLKNLFCWNKINCSLLISVIYACSLALFA